MIARTALPQDPKMMMTMSRNGRLCLLSLTITLVRRRRIRARPLRSHSNQGVSLTESLQPIQRVKRAMCLVVQRPHSPSNQAAFLAVPLLHSHSNQEVCSVAQHPRRNSKAIPVGLVSSAQAKASLSNNSSSRKTKVVACSAQAWPNLNNSNSRAQVAPGSSAQH